MQRFAQDFFVAATTFLLLLLAAPAKADPIIYQIVGNASGAIGGSSFTNVLVTVTLTGDTSNVAMTTLCPTCVVNLGTTTVNIPGIGTAMVTDQTGVFSSVATVVLDPSFPFTTYVAIGTLDHPPATDSQTPIAGIGSNSLLNYGLRTPIGPITAIPGGVGYDSCCFIHTTLGNLTFASNIEPTGQGTFTASAAPTSFVPVAGVWWNKNEPGSGLGIDYHNGTLIAEVYSYLPTGPSQWYLAAGPITNNVFHATLDKYTGGQCISCAYVAPTLIGNDGTITITFTSPTTATVDLPGGRHIQVERYFGSPAAAGQPGSFTPLAGVWWNSQEPGSGYGLDYQNGTLIAEVYSYLANGGSQWYLAAGPVSNNVFTATLDKYVGGQCISCTYIAPTLMGNDGTMTITFTSATTATVALPGGRNIQIQRYFQP
jgi:hypothetical protein